MELPNDILTLFISYLDPLTLLITEQVSVRWKDLTRVAWLKRKTFLVDQLYYYVKQHRDITQSQFDRLCAIIIKKIASNCIGGLDIQICQFTHDELSLSTYRVSPETAMRLYLQRMNRQYLAQPRWRPLEGRCLTPPALHAWLSWGLVATDVRSLCLYNIKMNPNDFQALSNFANLQTLILWPMATSWYSIAKQNDVSRTLSGMTKLKKLKIFTILPDLLFNTPASIESFTVQLVNTVSNRVDELTRNVFQNALHRFLDEHSNLKKFTVLVRTKHMNYDQLIYHVSLKTPQLTCLKCQYNFKFGALDLLPLAKLRHFGVRQNFLLTFDYTQRAKLSENLAKTIGSNFSIEKLSFKNCHLINSNALPVEQRFQFDAIKSLKFVNIFGNNNELLHSLFKSCPNLHTLKLRDVKPLTDETLSIIGDYCKRLTDVKIVDNNPDLIKIHVDALKRKFQWKSLTIKTENNTLECFSSLFR